MKYYKNLSIDESDFSVQRQGCRIHLTTTEYQLFITLLDHSGHICSRNFLLASVNPLLVPVMIAEFQHAEFQQFFLYYFMEKEHRFFHRKILVILWTV